MRRAGAVSSATLLHPDYHTPRDEPERIDIAKLTRMAQWMYATGWALANAAERPAIDPGISARAAVCDITGGAVRQMSDSGSQGQGAVPWCGASLRYTE